jgi:hypothetical protein
MEEWQVGRIMALKDVELLWVRSGTPKCDCSLLTSSLHTLGVREGELNGPSVIAPLGMSGVDATGPAVLL